MCSANGFAQKEKIICIRFSWSIRGLVIIAIVDWVEPWN